MKIVLEEYTDEWEVLFLDEKKKLRTLFSDFSLIVEHIGSTAIKGLAAKPIIDIMIGISDFRNANDLIPLFEKNGYAYISKYEHIMPYRRFFVKQKNGIKSHHVHVVETNSEFWKRHLKFRDHLRTNSADCQQYLQLKRELAAKEWNSGSDYADAKGEFIRSIENTSN